MYIKYLAEPSLKFNSCWVERGWNYLVTEIWRSYEYLPNLTMWTAEFSLAILLSSWKIYKDVSLDCTEQYCNEVEKLHQSYTGKQYELVSSYLC